MRVEKYNFLKAFGLKRHKYQRKKEYDNNIFLSDLLKNIAKYA
jgi:hypothetical protein